MQWSQIKYTGVTLVHHMSILFPQLRQVYQHMDQGLLSETCKENDLGHKHLVAIQFSHSVVSDSFWHHGLQHARLPCPSPTPGAYSNSCPSSRWCHPTISSSVVPFSSCLQSFPESEYFLISRFFTSGGPSIGVSASASVLPMNTDCSTQSQTATATGPMRKATWECVLSRSSQALYDPMA